MCLVLGNRLFTRKRDFKMSPPAVQIAVAIENSSGAAGFVPASGRCLRQFVQIAEWKQKFPLDRS